MRPIHECVLEQIWTMTTRRVERSDSWIESVQLPIPDWVYSKGVGCCWGALERALSMAPVPICRLCSDTTFLCQGAGGITCILSVSWIDCWWVIDRCLIIGIQNRDENPLVQQDSCQTHFVGWLGPMVGGIYLYMAGLSSPQSRGKPQCVHFVLDLLDPDIQGDIERAFGFQLEPFW